MAQKRKRIGYKPEGSGRKKNKYAYDKLNAILLTYVVMHSKLPTFLEIKAFE